MEKLHTDREILRCVYDLYRSEYPAKGDPHVPIDVHVVADKLGCSPNLLFGRLHYDMGTRFRHRDPMKANVTLASVFEVKVGERRHCVNFPYLSAVLATLEESRERDMWSIGLSVTAIIIATVSAAIQWVTA